MSVIVSSTADCQNIVVRVLANSYGLGGVQPNAEPLQIKVRQMDSFFEYTVSNTSSDVVTIVTPSQVGGDSHGVFMVEVFQAGNVVGKAATLLACDILCCIASKMEELLDCDCDCNKCSEHFVEAQKIFLLIKSAESQLDTAYVDNLTLSQIHAIIDSAREKYKTAQDMCAGHCGCNC